MTKTCFTAIDHSIICLVVCLLRLQCLLYFVHLICGNNATFFCVLPAQIRVTGFENLGWVASAVQSVGEPSTGLAFLDRCSIVLLGDLTRVRIGR